MALISRNGSSPTAKVDSMPEEDRVLEDGRPRADLGNGEHGPEQGEEARVRLDEQRP